MTETLEKLCKEGLALENSLRESEAIVHEMASRNPLLDMAKVTGVHVAPDCAVATIPRDLHSPQFLSAWLGEISKLLGPNLGVIISNRKGRIVESFYKGWDLSLFRMQSDLVTKFVRKAILSDEVICSIKAVLHTKEETINPTDNHERNEPFSKPDKLFAVSLNRLSKLVGTPLCGKSFELPNSAGFATLLFDASNQFEERSRILLDGAKENNDSVLPALMKELDAWFLLKRCRWGMRWTQAVEWICIHPKALLIPLGIMACILAMPIPYYPRRDCTFEPELRHYVASPVAGRISSCEVVPGDRVSKGQLLARLDEEQMRRDLATAEAELEGAIKKNNAAIASKSSGEAGMARVEITRAQTKIESLQEQMKRMEVRANSPGIVVQGDWKKSIGMPVTLGQNLFEIAELDSMVAEVQLHAYDLCEVKVGDQVAVRADCSGNQSFQGEISRIEPRAIVIDNEAVFIADVVIRDPELRLRPGMQASAQIEAGWRSVAWMLFSRPYRWLINQWVW
jgi:biotin carboxyl carrier protein